jgi:hypothetical protein
MNIGGGIPGYILLFVFILVKYTQYQIYRLNYF